MKLCDKPLKQLLSLPLLALCMCVDANGANANQNAKAPILNLAELDVSDPALRSAYEKAFQFTSDDLNSTKPPAFVQIVIDDLRQRGKSATPLLIRMVEDTSASGDLAASVLNGISEIEAGDIAMICERVRAMWRSRSRSIDITLATSVACFLAKHGQQSDLLIIEEIESRITGPREILDLAKRCLIKRFEQNKSTKSVVNPPPVQSSQKPTSSTLRSVIAVLIVAATVSLWLLLRKRK
jgi:hypothetical protein